MPSNDPPFPNVFDHMPRFSQALREHRTLCGMSVEELAEAAGIAPGALRDIEAGRRAAPPKGVIVRLARALRLRGNERDDLESLAELESPFVGALLGRTPATPPPSAADHTLHAAIFAFLIADVRGYTRYTQAYGDDAAAALTRSFAEQAHAVAERWDGRVVEVRGDEVLAVFASARQALHAAQDLHERYAADAERHPGWPEGIGIGLDVGEPTPVEDGYRGAALNRAARLCSLAGPGETLVSTGMVYIAPHVAGVSFLPRGQEQLKGFESPMPILLAAPSPVVEAPAEEE